MVQCGFLPTSDESCTIVNTEEQIQIYDNIEALYLFHDKVNTITWNKLYSASLFSYIRFPNGKIHEDHFTTYKVVYESKKIAVTNQTLIFYRERPNSIMTSKYSKKRLDIVLATEEKLNL